MVSETTPLIPSGVTPPSDAPGSSPTVYFIERRDSNAAHSAANPTSVNQTDAEEIETIPEGSTVEEFNPRPLTTVGDRSNVDGAATSSKSKRRGGGWISFFSNVGKKSNAFAGNPSIMESSVVLPRSAPVKVDPKVFFANERTFLAWMHVSVILAGASVAIVAFSDASSVHNQLYGVILLPVSIAFILYAMMQCE